MNSCNQAVPAADGVLEVETPDDRWVLICALSDLAENSGQRVLIDGLPPLAIWRVNEAIYVTDDTCTHGGSSLTKDGYLEGTTIECGLHQGCFNLTDGKVLAAPCRKPLRTYPVLIRNMFVYIDISIEQAS